MSNFRLSEMSFAYERAAGVIESECVVAEPHVDALENGWFDLESTSVELDDEVAYLESRNLLQRHPEHPHWVTIRDEGDPLPGVDASTENKPTLAAYLINRILSDPRVAYHFDPFTQSMEMLTAQYAQEQGRDVEEYRASLYPKLRFEKPKCNDCCSDECRYGGRHG